MMKAAATMANGSVATGLSQWEVRDVRYAADRGGDPRVVGIESPQVLVAVITPIIAARFD